MWKKNNQVISKLRKRRLVNEGKGTRVGLVVKKVSFPFLGEKNYGMWSIFLL